MAKLARTLLVVAVVAGGIGALWYYDRLPGKTLLQSYAGVIAEPYRVYNHARASQREQFHGNSENWADYDYFLRIETDNGKELRVAVPAAIWYESDTGYRVSKALFSIYPTVTPALVDAETDGSEDAAAAAGEASDATADAEADAAIAQADPGPAPARFEVTFVCDHGEFTAEFIRDWAPLGVERIYDLVADGAFDGCKFFRVVRGFVVQFGIPADPAKAARWRDARIQDDPVKQSNVRGTITFAAAGPNTRTSQIFINLGDNTALDQQGFAPVGRVIAGMDVVDAINAEYGEKPDQSLIQTLGDQYLSQQFPNLTVIQEARIAIDAPDADQAEQAPESAPAPAPAPAPDPEPEQEPAPPSSPDTTADAPAGDGE